MLKYVSHYTWTFLFDRPLENAFFHAFEKKRRFQITCSVLSLCPFLKDARNESGNEISTKSFLNGIKVKQNEELNIISRRLTETA